MNSTAKTFLTAVVAVAGAAVMALVLADQTTPKAPAPGRMEMAVRELPASSKPVSQPSATRSQAAWRESGAAPRG